MTRSYDRCMVGRAHFRVHKLVALSLLLCGLALPSVASASSLRTSISTGLLSSHERIVAAVSDEVSFRVVLAPRNPARLDALIVDQNTPGSPWYHHYLSSPQFFQSFGPRPSDLSRLSSFFTARGLSVQRSSTNSLVLEISGPSSNVSAAFNSRLAMVAPTGGIASTQFVAPASLPAEVAAGISGIVGLNAHPRYHHNIRNAQYPTTKSMASPNATTPNCSGLSATASIGGFLPSQQAAAYGADTLTARGYSGRTQTIALYELGNYSSSDISNYFTCLNVSPTLSTVLVDGGATGAADSETTLDIEQAGVIAPGAALKIYLGPNNVKGPVDVFARIAADNTASIVSVSWGICESQSDAKIEAPIFSQMAAQGQTVFAASGDSGSSDCAASTDVPPTSDCSNNVGSTCTAVDDPASQPLVTGVGGVVVNSLSPLDQSVWNDGSGAAGGGASSLWPQPAWQTVTGLANAGKRMVPDLSVMADPSYGFIQYYKHQWVRIGGTSMGPPLLAGVAALSAESCAAGRLGFLNPRLYQLAQAGVGFNDVTTGDNNLYGQYDATSAPLYQAATGYDMASGLGTPQGANFTSGICPSVVSSALSSLSAPTTVPLTTSTLSISGTLRDHAGLPIVGAYLAASVTAGSSGVLSSTSTLTSNTGAYSFAVVKLSPGTVSVRVTSNGTTVATSTTTVGGGGSAQVVSGLIASLSATGPVATTLNASRIMAAARNKTGHVLLSSTSRVVDLSAKFGLKSATTDPALSCNGVNCSVAWVAGSHLVVVIDADGPAPRLSDLTAINAAGVGVNGVVAISDTRIQGSLTIAYVTTTGHLFSDVLQVATNKWTLLDRSTQLKIPLATGTPSLLGSLAQSGAVAVRAGASYWVVASSPKVSAVEVGGATHFSTSGSNSLVGNPVLVSDHGHLALLGRTSGGAVVIFSATTASPWMVSLATTVASSNLGATSQWWVSTSLGWCVLVRNRVGAYSLVAPLSSWTALDANSLFGLNLTNAVVSSGVSPVLTIAGRSYQVTA